MEDLLCCESQKENLSQVYKDRSLLDDHRVISYLLETEEKYTLHHSYFNCVQKHLQPFMREVVGRWMLEVCENEECAIQVFPLAMNCMDRFLSVVEIKKSQLQLLGSVCLFVGSKLRQTRPLSSERLCLYTDYSITHEEILNWELLLLSRLKWDVAAITAHDFVSYILERLSLPQDHYVVIRRHAHTFIDLCSLDFKFSMQPPSMIAAASIATAILGFTRRSSTEQDNYSSKLFNHLHEITGVEVDCLRQCLDQIEEMISEHRRAAVQHGLVSVSPEKSEPHKAGFLESENVSIERGKPDTPTDVQDVHF